jgi:ABC-type transporter Mla MlaB component
VLKITPTRENETSLTVRLCGQLTKEYLPEVERTLAGDSPETHTVALDLANVTFVDREAMVFLCSAKARNIAIRIALPMSFSWISRNDLRHLGDNLQPNK